MPGTNEAFSRVKIDAQLKDQGWDVLNTNAVRFEHVLPDRTKADQRRIGPAPSRGDSRRMKYTYKNFGAEVTPAAELSVSCVT
jgi:hypothetical protein